jgi:hypothetical protein
MTPTLRSIALCSLCCLTSSVNANGAIQIHNASNTQNAKLQGTSEIGSLILSEALNNATGSTGSMEFSITELDLNNDGGKDDKITVRFNIKGSASLQTSKLTASGWLSPGTVNFTEAGQWITITLDSLTTHIAGKQVKDNSLFLGFNGCTMGSWNIAEQLNNKQRDGATINGKGFLANGQNEQLELGKLTNNLKISYRSAKGNLGEWRLKGLSFQIKQPTGQPLPLHKKTASNRRKSTPQLGALISVGSISLMLAGE